MESVLTAVNEALKQHGCAAFSNWDDVESRFGLVLSGGGDYLRAQFTRELTDIEQALLERCPAPASSASEKSVEMVFNKTTFNDCFWCDQNTVREVRFDVFTCDLQGSRVFELDAGDSGDCYRYYEFKAIWNVCFEYSRITRRLTLTSNGEPDFDWESSDI